MSQDTLDLPHEKFGELLDAMAEISRQIGGCVHFPEYDRATKTIALTVELVGPT